MLAAEIGDPRLEAIFGGNVSTAQGVLPIVRLPRKGVPPALFAIAAVLLSAILFSILNERRTRQAQPTIPAKVADGPTNFWSPPPPLFIPPTEDAASILRQRLPKVADGALSTPLPIPLGSGNPARPMSLRPAVPPPSSRPFPNTQRQFAGAPPLIDHSAIPAPPRTVPAVIPSSGASELPSTERVRASLLANPSLTVLQGSLIPAVLETGLDSSKPGFARAIVSRDIRSFDGTKVLIPRGSRLIGESSSSVANGQKRAMITWTRLIRPDGATIEIDSPATDTVGRAGIPASVNSHLLARIGDAVGKTIVELSQIIVAARAGPFFVIPGTGNSVGPQRTPKPARVSTLRVAPGTSISVFVAHDLDFSVVGDDR